MPYMDLPLKDILQFNYEYLKAQLEDGLSYNFFGFGIDPAFIIEAEQGIKLQYRDILFQI